MANCAINNKCEVHMYIEHDLNVLDIVEQVFGLLVGAAGILERGGIKAPEGGGGEDILVGGDDGAVDIPVSGDGGAANIPTCRDRDDVVANPNEVVEGVAKANAEGGVEEIPKRGYQDMPAADANVGDDGSEGSVGGIW